MLGDLDDEIEEEAFGYACFVGSHNLLQKERVKRVSSILGDDKFRLYEWKGVTG